MRRVTCGLLTLLLMVGLLVFLGIPKSQAVASESCTQDCYNLYSACLGQGQGDFFYCCAAYNQCLAENCGSSAKYHLPEPYPTPE